MQNMSFGVLYVHENCFLAFPDKLTSPMHLWKTVKSSRNYLLRPITVDSCCLLLCRGYDHTHANPWRCNNVCGLDEHNLSHVHLCTNFFNVSAYPTAGTEGSTFAGCPSVRACVAACPDEGIL